MRRLNNTDVAVLLALVLLGTVGRVGRVDWNFTPIAATAIFAGMYFGRAWMAALVPMVAMAISNLFEPAHNNLLEAVAVYGCLLVPALCGKHLAGVGPRQWPRWIVGCVAPSIVFFLVTNWAVWFSSSAYPSTWAGLAECYTAAIPFYRNMLAGDIFWTGTLVAAWSLASAGESRRIGA